MKVSSGLIVFYSGLWYSNVFDSSLKWSGGPMVVSSVLQWSLVAL